MASWYYSTSWLLLPSGFFLQPDSIRPFTSMEEAVLHSCLRHVELFPLVKQTGKSLWVRLLWSLCAWRKQLDQDACFLFDRALDPSVSVTLNLLKCLVLYLHSPHDVLLHIYPFIWTDPNEQCNAYTLSPNSNSKVVRSQSLDESSLSFSKRDIGKVKGMSWEEWGRKMATVSQETLLFHSGLGILKFPPQIAFVSLFWPVSDSP